MADADGRLNQTDRDGNLPLPCSFMDIHICGACKTQFNNVELFIAHKQQSCPVFVEIRSISFEHLATTCTGITQTTSPNVTVPGSLPLTTETTNSIASSIVTPSLTENTATTFPNHPVAGSVQINGPHPGDEVESNGHLIHRLHCLTNTIDRQNDHADQSLSAKLELSFLDVQQVVREEFKNRNNSKNPFLLSSATNCHHLIEQSQNTANLMSQKILQAAEDHNTVTQISHSQKPNHIADVISRPSQTMTSKQLMHTLELNPSANTSSSEQVLVKSVQHQATEMTATTAVTQHFFADQIITEPLDNLAAIASNNLQTGQQPQLTTNFPLQHREPQQSLDNETTVSSVPSSSLSLSVMNGQSSNSAEDSYELRMMTGTDGAPVQVPTRSYMAIVEEFEVSPTSNMMLNECETEPASPIQQPPPLPPPPPDESQQQNPPSLQIRHPTPQSHASVHISGEVSNNFDTDRGSTSVLVLRNDTNHFQPVLPLTNFLASTQASTKQSSATNVNKVSLKNRQAPKKKFKCTFGVCEFQTAYLKDLERHTRTHTGERPFQCQVCRKSFNRSDKLKIHQRVHTGNKPYQCQICSYSSVDSSSLKKHMRIHTDERPFKCQMCSYASRNSSQLIVHLRTHTGDSPFQCQLCDAKFKINSDLKRHVRTHTGEKPFKCEFCDYRCSIKANLKSHHYRINHSTENQFQCDTCSFTSSSKKMYKEHIKTHDTDRPIKCRLCMYKCSRKSALITHLRTHSDERPVRCDFCTYTSKQNSNVKTHMKKKHAEKLRQKKKNLSHKSSEPVKKIGEVMTNRTVEVATSSNVDDINGAQVRIKLNCKKAYNCQQCDASFVRQDSLLSHVRQHQNIEKALQSTAMAVLQLQNPVRPLNQQFSSNGTSDCADQVPSQHTLNSSKAGSEQCLTPTLPAISTSVTVSKSVSNPASLFSSTSLISSRLNPKISKDNLAFQQSHLNISNVSDGQISNQENHSLLNDLSSSQKSLLSSFSQPVNIASIPSNNSLCSQQPQPTESIQSCLNISQNNPNIVSMATDTDDPKEIISQSSINHNTSVSNNLIQLRPQQKRITDNIGQSLHGNMISSPVSTMATTSQTNVSQVLPSSVTSPGVSTNSQSVVNSYLLNNQPQQGTIVTPQFLQNLTALQLISNVSLPFFRMPTAQMGTQTAQILPNQFLSQPHEQINIMSSPLASTLNTSQQQLVPSEIPVQIISQRNQQQNTIPINVQISQLNFDATAAAIRNEILDQCSSGAMIASFQVIVPQHMQPATTGNTVPPVCTLASASSLDSSAPTSIPASTRGEILVQVSSCPHTSHNTLCLPSDQSSHSSTNPSTVTPINSLPTNLISVIGQSLQTTADATDPHCKIFSKSKL